MLYRYPPQFRRKVLDSVAAGRSQPVCEDTLHARCRSFGRRRPQKRPGPKWAGWVTTPDTNLPGAKRLYPNLARALARGHGKQRRVTSVVDADNRPLFLLAGKRGSHWLPAGTTSVHRHRRRVYRPDHQPDGWCSG